VGGGPGAGAGKYAKEYYGGGEGTEVRVTLTIPGGGKPRSHLRRT